MRRTLAPVVFLVAASLVAPPVLELAVARTATCDATQTEPVYAGGVPNARDVLGFRLGRREVTVDQAWSYLDAVDAASDRVATGTYATSVQGRPLRYAVVGRPENVTPDGLAAIRDAVVRIRDPETPEAEVEQLAATTPAFLYVAGNVHGTEESGADAALRTLYDLADRTDCAAETILDHAVVFVLPIQNPDGREADTRRNAYGFDLNRDWFARTQPETDGKLELLRQYPPQLFVDCHEFGYYRSFFPPDDDPIHHEVSSQVLGWIDGIFGPALEREFERRDWGYFHGGGYDFFLPGYGDTVPADGFQAAGLTLETYEDAPFPLRFQKNRVEQWVLLFEAASHRDRLLVEQHDAYVDAVREGRRGILEPNEVYRSNADPLDPVADVRIRNYFIERSSGRRYEEQLLVRRLQRMGVDVYRLDAPLRVPDYRPYVGDVGPRILPTGTYWVPMAQPQKHWIQLMLGRDTYPPVRRTFDVTGWSSPLLMNLDGGSSGAAVDARATPVAPMDEPVWHGPRGDVPSIGILALSNAVYSFEGVGHLRWLFDQVWHLPYRVVSTDDVVRGRIDDLDVIVVPSGGALIGERRLGERGREALDAWIRSGGRYVGYRFGGALLADRLDLTSARFANSPLSIPGTLVRVHVDASSPLADGVGRWVWVMFDDDDLISVGRADAPMRYPTIGHGFETSGLALHTQQLAGQPAAVDEPRGDGRVVLFPFDVNYRAYTQGTQRILWNAIVGPDPR
jgi:Zinc carboxypeptidase